MSIQKSFGDLIIDLTLTFYDPTWLSERNSNGNIYVKARPHMADGTYTIEFEFPVYDIIYTGRYYVTGDYLLLFGGAVDIAGTRGNKARILFRGTSIGVDDLKKIISDCMDTKADVTHTITGHIVSIRNSNSRGFDVDVKFAYDKMRVNVAKVSCKIPKDMADEWYENFVLYAASVNIVPNMRGPSS